jgi:hypothetical protein
MALILEVEMGQVIDALHPFDFEILIFQNNMRAKVVKVIKPFL